MLSQINCVVRCCSVIFSVLNLKRSDDSSRPGADDFLPIFIYVVLKAQVPELYSNCEYIQNYHNPAALMSKVRVAPNVPMHTIPISQLHASSGGILLRELAERH